MDLDRHVLRVTEQLAAAAALGDERIQQLAAALASTAAPAVRLALLDALGAAAEEITARLLDAPGSPTVMVRLSGGDAVVEVRVSEVDADDSGAPDAASDGVGTVGGTDSADSATARISLRLDAHLKAKVDAAAGEDGVSVNTWLVRAATAAVHNRAAGSSARQRRSDSRRITGWIN